MNKHNQIYAILLGLLAFGILLAIGVNIFIVGTEGLMRFVLYSEILMASLCILTLILRFTTIEAGRILTKVLNVLLLLYFPLGTALGIYGFLKVDKQRTDTENGNLQPAGGA